jgi:thiamine biosynthesis lipoprotein
MHDRTEAAMGTLVTMRVVRGDESDIKAALDRAFGWFHEIENRCSRFLPHSESMRLCARSGEAVPVSPILYEAVKFALAVAEETQGAFDPTVGRRMAARGFNREHRSGDRIPADAAHEDNATYRDVHLNSKSRTIALRKPLTLDLGAVAKGLAIDTAARELTPFGDFAIDAGGDLFLGGFNEDGEPWSVGIRHPLRNDKTIETLRVSGRAVCTSGGYERRVTENDGEHHIGEHNDGEHHIGEHNVSEHHILDPRTGSSPREVASATVIAPNAMLADALATAAFVLGPAEGLILLERMGVDGLIITSDLERSATRGFGNAA